MSLLLLLMNGCAVTLPSPRTPLPDSLPIRAHLTEVPFEAQPTLHCGPAALAMVLQWTGVDTTPDRLAVMVYTPGRMGSLPSELVTAARRHGRLAYNIHDFECLMSAIANAQPVVVLQNRGLKWFPNWHYAVVVGYDDLNRHMILHSGNRAHQTVSTALFKRTWHRAGYWGLLVLKPGSLPACADETTYLQAALGLQQAGQLTAALVSFQTAVQQWPRNTAAYMALGNAYYAAGRLPDAEAAFRAAAGIDPGDATAVNNLAHVLAQQESLDEAETFAQRAVQLGGPHHEAYRQTLEQIRQLRQNRPE